MRNLTVHLLPTRVFNRALALVSEYDNRSYYRHHCMSRPLKGLRLFLGLRQLCSPVVGYTRHIRRHICSAIAKNIHHNRGAFMRLRLTLSPGHCLLLLLLSLLLRRRLCHLVRPPAANHCYHQLHQWASHRDHHAGALPVTCKPTMHFFRCQAFSCLSIKIVVPGGQGVGWINLRRKALQFHKTNVGLGP